jgi:4-amino-4-deoxy-L-arabinose transferase-like glycosyltransferase
MIAWLMAINTTIFGTFQTTVRLATVLAVTGLFAIAFQLGRELYGERAAFFGAVPLMLTPIFNAGGVLANTDGLLAFFWAVAVLGVKKAVLDGKRRAWLVYSLGAGLALLSKTTALFLIPSTALVLLGTAAGRTWLKRWEPYVATLTALLFFSPPLIWNMQHDWFTFSMRVGHQSAGGITLAVLAELLAAQLIVVTPLLFPWVLWGLWKAWRDRTDARAVLLGAYMAVPFLSYSTYSLFARAGVHWPAIGYVTGFVAAGAFTATATRRRGAARYLATACLPAMLITGLLFFIPVFPERITMTWSYWVRPEKVSTSQLDNIFDWGEAGAVIGEVRDEGGGDAFLLCRDGYGFAGLIAFYTPGRPETFIWKLQRRNGAAYDIWRNEADLVGRDAVIVDERLDERWFDELRGSFDSLSEPRHVEIHRGGRVIKEFYVTYGSNFAGFPDEDSRGGG